MHVMKCYSNLNNRTLFFFFKHRETHLWVYKRCNDENTCHEAEEYGSDGTELRFHAFFYQSNQNHHHNEAVYSGNDSSQHQLKIQMYIVGI